MTQLPIPLLAATIESADVISWEAPDGNTERLYARPPYSTTLVIEARDRGQVMKLLKGCQEIRLPNGVGFHLTADEVFFEDGTVTPFAEELLMTADRIVVEDASLDHAFTMDRLPTEVTISADLRNGQFDRVMAAVQTLIPDTAI